MKSTRGRVSLSQKPPFESFGIGLIWNGGCFVPPPTIKCIFSVAMTSNVSVEVSRRRVSVFRRKGFFDMVISLAAAVAHRDRGAVVADPRRRGVLAVVADPAMARAGDDPARADASYRVHS